MNKLKVNGEIVTFKYARDRRRVVASYKRMRRAGMSREAAKTVVLDLLFAMVVGWQFPDGKPFDPHTHWSLDA